MKTPYKLLACQVLREEATYLMNELGTADRFDAEWFEMGLHEKPERLNAELAERIAACAGKGYQAILLLFGLCSRATAGLEPPPDSRLVIPRVHDCVSLYLGSAQRYLAEHEAEAGTYWFSRGFLHRDDGGSPELGGLGVGIGAELAGPDGKRATLAEIRASFVDQYGEDNAEYLIEVLMESWKKNYKRAVHLEWEGNPHLEADRQWVADYARQNNWTCESRPVDLRLVRTLLGGPWPASEFVTVLPGQHLAATNDAEALCARGLGSP